MNRQRPIQRLVSHRTQATIPAEPVQPERVRAYMCAFATFAHAEDLAERFLADDVEADLAARGVDAIGLRSNSELPT
jgi:hypothetical protein